MGPLAVVDGPPVSSVDAAFRDWVAEQAPALRRPGVGSTWERFLALADVSGIDLALGRLSEGHADAIAILEEAGCSPVVPGPYGVWAARSAQGDLTATPVGTGWRIDGHKGFCSGAGMVEHALVTADAPDGPRLFDLDVTLPGVVSDPGSWPAVGMAASESVSVSFDGLVADAGQCVGPPGFYTGRIGFWWGAVGVSACWWGGARALLETVGQYLAERNGGDHELAAYGSAMARCQSMTETLRWAAAEIDDGDADVDRARRTARMARDVVHDGCMAILAAVAAAGGARPICLDAAQSRRSADLYAYLAQHHGGRDAAGLGRDLVEQLRLRPGK
jgi:alkylation response protein AidB-like acyl-CoA dehydrogenase